MRDCVLQIVSRGEATKYDGADVLYVPVKCTRFGKEDGRIAEIFVKDIGLQTQEIVLNKIVDMAKGPGITIGDFLYEAIDPETNLPMLAASVDLNQLVDYLNVSWEQA